jgi:hypothetical protein
METLTLISGFNPSLTCESPTEWLRMQSSYACRDGTNTITVMELLATSQILLVMIHLVVWLKTIQDLILVDET